MKENSIKNERSSIEEDIKILEEMIENANIENMDMNNCFGGEHIEAIEHILSDYKRVLKENELLRKDIEGWKKYCEEIEEEQTEISNKNCKLEFEIEKLQKENEELKQDRNTNYQMIVLAQNEMLGYIQGYEDGKKLKRSAVACAVENQQYYIIKKEIEHYKEYIEKLQKENEKYKRLSEMNLKNAEEFKNNMCEHRCLLKSENEELQRENEELKKFITEGITVAPHSPYKNYRLDFLRENFVSKKKIKDKIEELKNTPLKIKENDKYYYETDAYNKIVVQVLQELLEGRE